MAFKCVSAVFYSLPLGLFSQSFYHLLKGPWSGSQGFNRRALRRYLAPRKCSESSLTVPQEAPFPLCAHLPSLWHRKLSDLPSTQAQSQSGLSPGTVQLSGQPFLKRRTPISTHALHAKVTQKPMRSPASALKFYSRPCTFLGL